MKKFACLLNVKFLTASSIEATSPIDIAPSVRGEKTSLASFKNRYVSMNVTLKAL